MQLITILNRCHRFWGFVYQHARFGADKKSIEVAVRPRKGSAAVCSRCDLPAPDYDQLAERRFEFIPRWGFLVFSVHHAARRLVAAVALWLSKKCPGATANAH
jgi:transposase